MSRILLENGTDGLQLENGSSVLLELVDVVVADPNPTFLDLDRDSLVLLERSSYLDLDIRTRIVADDISHVDMDARTLVEV